MVPVPESLENTSRLSSGLLGMVEDTLDVCDIQGEGPGEIMSLDPKSGIR